MPRGAGRRASGAGPPEAASAAPPSGPPSSGPGPSIASAIRASQVPVRRVSRSKRSSACPARTGALQRVRDPRPVRPDAPVAERRGPGRTALAADGRPQDPQAGGAGDAGGHRVEPRVRLRQRLPHVRDAARAVPGRPPHPPDVRAKRADVVAGPERPPQEPVGQELPDPLAVQHVAPAPRDPPPHPRRTRQHPGAGPLQDLAGGDPVHRGRLHRHLPDPAGRQPVRHLQEVPGDPPNDRTGSGNRSGSTARWWTSLPMPVPAQSRFTIPGFPAFPFPFRPRGIPAPPPFHRSVRAGRSHGAFPIPWTGSRRSRAISDRRRSRFGPRSCTGDMRARVRRTPAAPTATELAPAAAEGQPSRFTSATAPPPRDGLGSYET